MLVSLYSHVTSASRQLQLSHVSHENVTQSPNPFQHYSQCLGNYISWCYPAVLHAHICAQEDFCPTAWSSHPFTMPTLMLELDSASHPNPLQCLAFLRARTPLQMRLQNYPPSLPSPLLTLPHPCFIFSLVYNPYAPAGPLTYASKATLTHLIQPPLTIITLAVPSQHSSNATYQFYAHVVPTRHASDAPLTLASSSRPLMILMLLQPPQDETTMPPSPPPYILRLFPSLCSRGALKICLQHQP
ncbi:hypothetical protein O181_026027 [Austropuccinia psidii MF-1]|uniref:Uncharacterized protein n=1 Tax=Austropuccinia psidii MF-1 TaxID=1389203 RepID=A0A9Q3H0F1_9BASI|nr:hypothetical protein [Austropuccinia psidii MF-1]